MPAAAQGVGYPYMGYEYRSEAELFGLPLLHVARGIDRETGRPLIARGVIAVGNVAFGLLFALGGVAFGGIAFGGLSIGLLALGGMAVGFAALGGASFGVLFAAGGVAEKAVENNISRADIEMDQMMIDLRLIFNSCKKIFMSAAYA